MSGLVEVIQYHLEFRPGLVTGGSDTVYRVQTRSGNWWK